MTRPAAARAWPSQKIRQHFGLEVRWWRRILWGREEEGGTADVHDWRRPVVDGFSMSNSLGEGVVERRPRARRRRAAWNKHSVSVTNVIHAPASPHQPQRLATSRPSSATAHQSDPGSRTPPPHHPRVTFLHLRAEEGVAARSMIRSLLPSETASKWRQASSRAASARSVWSGPM